MRILHLADCPHFHNQIAEWNVEEWPSYYDGQIEKALKYHASTMNRGMIPTCLVAVLDGELAGTVSLVVEDLETSREREVSWL